MDFIFDDDVDEVGSEVEAFCPKCKVDTTHVVMSKYEDEIRKVQCNPCGDVHAYRKPRGESEEEVHEPVAAKKRAAKAKPTWEQVMAKAKKEPKLYMIADRYSENELISHPIFGVGFVSDVMGDNKIEITFQAEKRVLIHNRKGMSLPPSAYAHPVDTTIVVVGKGKGGKGKTPAAPPAPSARSDKDRRKQAVKQAVAKSAEVKAARKAEAKAVPAKAAPAKPTKAPAPKPAAPVKLAKPVKGAARPAAKAKPKARAAAPARSKPAARAASKPKKQAKKR